MCVCDHLFLDGTKRALIKQSSRQRHHSPVNFFHLTQMWYYPPPYASIPQQVSPVSICGSIRHMTLCHGPLADQRLLCIIAALWYSSFIGDNRCNPTNKEWRQWSHLCTLWHSYLECTLESNCITIAFVLVTASFNLRYSVPLIGHVYLCSLEGNFLSFCLFSQYLRLLSEDVAETVKIT